MPVYNAGQFVLGAVDSVLNQSFNNLELLICDDASSDETWEKINSIEDPRVKIFRNEYNIGAGATRNFLLSIAEAPWIAFLDADDEWSLERLEKIFSLEVDDDTIIFDDIEECFFDLEKNLKFSRRMRGEQAFFSEKYPKLITASQLIRSNRMLIQPVFPKKLFEETGAAHSNHPYGEDSYFLLKLLSTGAKLLYVPEALYRYRISEGSASSNPKKYDLLIEVLHECLGFYQPGSDVHFSLLEKIEDVKYGRKVFKFSQNIKKMNIFAAIKIAREEPSVLLDALLKAMHHFGFLDKKGRLN